MALEAKNALSNAARTKIEREVRVQYFKLLHLPYLDIVRCHLIKPMLNIFLETAKNILRLSKTYIGQIFIYSGCDWFCNCASPDWKITIKYSIWIFWIHSGTVDVVDKHLSTTKCGVCFCSRLFIHHSELVKGDRKFEDVFGKHDV